MGEGGGDGDGGVGGLGGRMPYLRKASLLFHGFSANASNASNMPE